jgi:hypothetical protein
MSLNKIIGFEEISAPTRPIMTLGTHGAPRTGKTHFAGTAPDPIGWLPTDRNSRWTAAKIAKQLGKKILIPDKDLIRVTGTDALRLSQLPPEEAIKFYRKRMNDLKTMYFRLLENKQVRTVVIDTFGQVWEDVMFANYGRNMRILPRDRGAANQEMRDFIGACDKNLILLHQSKQVWKDDKATDDYEIAGWPHIKFGTNACVEHGKVTKKSAIKNILALEAGEEVPTVLFKLNIYDSQANPMLAADAEDSTLYGDACTFQQVAMKIFPSSELEDWD